MIRVRVPAGRKYIVFPRRALKQGKYGVPQTIPKEMIIDVYELDEPHSEDHWHIVRTSVAIFVERFEGGEIVERIVVEYDQD